MSYRSKFAFMDRDRLIERTRLISLNDLRASDGSYAIGEAVFWRWAGDETNVKQSFVKVHDVVDGSGKRYAYMHRCMAGRKAVVCRELSDSDGLDMMVDYDEEVFDGVKIRFNGEIVECTSVTRERKIGGGRSKQGLIITSHSEEDLRDK